MILSFILSKAIKNDPVESSLSLKGVTSETTYGQKEYAYQYKLMNLDKPLFYLTILPHYYPRNIHSYTHVTDKVLINNLLKEKIHFNWIQDYLTQKSLVLEEIKDPLAYQQLIDKLNYSNSFKEIKHLNTFCQTLDIESHNYKNLQNSLETLESFKIKYYYPVLFWHGGNNQFHQWASKIMRGNWGISFKDGQNVKTKILKALKWTSVLTIISLILSISISYVVGLLMAYHSNTFLDRFLRYFWLILYTMPVFWLASLLITYTTTDRYGVFLNMFPIPGRWYIPEGENFWMTFSKYAYQIVLPIICLIANDISPVSQLIRNNILSQKHKPFVLLSRSKGMTSFESFRHHLLPHSWITLTTVISGKIPALLSGSLIIEVIFNIPGAGRLTYDSILSADWNVVLGVLICMSFIVILTMLLTDIAYRYIDPRLEKSTL